MLSFYQAGSLFTKLTQNAASTNLDTFGRIYNIEHRYLLQDFFNNETSYSITTVGNQNGTLTAIPSVGATSATLSATWTGNTTQISIQFSSGEYRNANFTTGSTAITWSGPLVDTNTTDAISIGGQQFYPLPPNYSKLKDITITIGNLRWTLDEISDRKSWDTLNVFPYYADIPANYFIYPGGDRGAQIGIWPIPSTTGNVITFNYKFRVPDLSLPDYGSINYTSLSGTLYVGETITNNSQTATIEAFTSSNIVISGATGAFSDSSFTTSGSATGTVSSIGLVSINNGSTSLTGTNTSFVPTTNQSNESRWIQIQQPDGDALWYQIASVVSSTEITLYQPYQGINVSNSQNWSIGQMPLIAEDFQDMPMIKGLVWYFSSIVDNDKKAKEWEDEYQKKAVLLKKYSGTNTISVNLSRKINRRNPNSYPLSLQGGS